MAIDFGDIASRYATARLDQAMQPFTDPEAYANNRLQQQFGVDLGGNVKPKSTTITNNDDGTQTVTQKHEVAQTPTYAGPGIGEGAYQLPEGAVSTAEQQLNRQVAPAVTSQQLPLQGAVSPAEQQLNRQATPVVTPDTAAIDEQRRRQLEQLQLQQAQAAQQSQQMAPAPSGPAVPTVEREVPQAAPMPVNPQAVAPVALPQFGPGVQVAGGPPGTGVAQAAQLATAATVPNPDEQHQQAIIDAHNEKDPVARRQKFARLAATEGVSEGNRQLAHQYMAEEYLNDKQVKKAEQKLATATPLDIQRYMKDKSPEGSYVKAILFARLGLNDLARQEQEKISPSVAMGSEIGADGQRYSVVRNKEGFITKAFDTTGTEATPEKVAELSASSMATKGNIGHAGATRVRDSKGNEWSVVPTTRGSQFYDNTGKPGVPEGKTVPITVGGDVGLQRELSISRAQVALSGKKGAEAISVIGDLNKKLQAEGLPTVSYDDVGINDRGEFVGSRAGAQPVATGGVPKFKDASIEIISAQRPTAEQQAMYDAAKPDLAKDPSGQTRYNAAGNPVARPGTSAHEGPTGNAFDVNAKKLTRAGREELTRAGYYQPIPQQDPNHWERLPGAAPAGGAPAGGAPAGGVAELTRQREEAAKIATKRGESFNKHVDETITPDAVNGDSIAATRKQQFAIFERPGVDAGKIFGIANGAGSAPGDQRWTMFRDILLGKVSEPEDKIRERAAALGLNREEQSAVAEYAIANADINSKTLKSTAGPGSISDAEQKINQQRNVDPTKVPMLGGYNAMAQSQFNGDLARYKGDWATTSTATNTAQLEKDWRKEKEKLVKMYTDVATDRIKYIADMGNTPAAIKEGYKRFPVPQYDPNANDGNGGWIKKKPIGSYER